MTLFLQNSPLIYIIVFSLLGGVLSVLLASSIALSIHTTWIPMLVSYAVGAMLGAVFFEILPHAIAATHNTAQFSINLLGGLLLFFTLEKLVIWRHCHGDTCEVHTPPEASVRHQRLGAMVIVGNILHNFLDGVIIAVAFMVSIPLGLVTALAIIAHEIPQEVGDFVVLLHAQYSRREALYFNLLASGATLLGGVLTYLLKTWIIAGLPLILSLSCASLLYVALTDLIPHLHQRSATRTSLLQMALISLGIASVWMVQYMVGE